MDIQLILQVNKVVASSSKEFNMEIKFYVNHFDFFKNKILKTVIFNSTFGFCDFDDREKKFTPHNDSEWRRFVSAFTDFYKIFNLGGKEELDKSIEEFWEKRGKKTIEHTYTFQVLKFL